MASCNKVFLIGNLTRDPELRYTAGGTPVANLGLATSRKYKSKEGELKEETCFVTLVAWGRQAELAGEYLKKGSPVFVEGRLIYRSWETANKEKRSTLEVRIERLQFLGKAPVPTLEGEVTYGEREKEKEEKEKGEATSEGM
ncbi:MAG: single-stranded DNA-binding protein [Candidatus Omnitrophica bacterium]|nr:single-stranded DNA-binding protein [Candidatus Omnitrophota bacterium]